jgi:TPR repeat protein
MAEMKIKLLIFAPILLLVWGSAAYANDAEPDSAFYNGVSAYRARDYDEAVDWFLKAAEAGDVDAQFLLGRMHYDGNSITVNLVTAYMWFDIAAEHGIHVGARYRNGIARDMSEEEVALAKKRADEWRRAHPAASTQVQ